MAQLFFHYGTMSSGKTLEILKDAHNYEAQGRKIVLMTSGVDNRSGVGTIASRIGLHRKAIPIEHDMDIFAYIEKINDQEKKLGDGPFACVFVLKNDFQNNLFEGSKNLLIVADKINEIKTICHYCGRKATMNLRIHEGKPVYEGEQVQIGGDESYYPVCRFHYFHPNEQR